MNPCWKGIYFQNIRSKIFTYILTIYLYRTYQYKLIDASLFYIFVFVIFQLYCLLQYIYVKLITLSINDHTVLHLPHVVMSFRALCLNHITTSFWAEMSCFSGVWSSIRRLLKVHYEILIGARLCLKVLSVPRKVGCICLDYVGPTLENVLGW